MELTPEENDLILLGEICRNPEHHELVQRLICRAEERGRVEMRGKCAALCDEEARLAAVGLTRDTSAMAYRMQSAIRALPTTKEKT